MTAARSRLHAIARGARHALGWWNEGLKKALPARLMEFVLGDTREIRLDRDESGRMTAHLLASPYRPHRLAQAVIDGEGLVPVASRRPILKAGRTRPVVLRAPAETILTQTVTLPALAQENLPQAVRFGLSKWTPFPPDAVVFVASVIRIVGEQAKVRIDLVPRTALEPLVRQAAAAGLVVTAIAVGTHSVAWHEPGGRRPGWRADRIDLGLLAGAAVLALGLLTLVHLRWADELARLRTAIQGEIAHRSRQTALEGDLSRLEEGRRAVLLKRAREPRIATIVGELAERLPETVETVELVWGGERGQVRLSGEAGDLRQAFEPSAILKIDGIGRATRNQIVVDLSLKGDRQ